MSVIKFVKEAINLQICYLIPVTFGPLREPFLKVWVASLLLQPLFLHLALFML